MHPLPETHQAPWWLKPVPLVVFLIIWEITVNRIERGAFFYGSPSLIWKALVYQATSGILWDNLSYTLSAVLLGFVIGNLAGITVGLILAFWPRVASVFRPYLTVLGALPVIAFAPIIVILFGIEFLPKVALAAFATFVVATAQTFEGAMQTPRGAIALMESLGATRTQIFFKIVMPSSLVWVFSSLRLNVGVSILAVFIAEFITSKPGLGYQIVVDMGLFKTSSVLASVVVIAALSLLLTSAIGLLQDGFSQWRKTV